MGGTNAGPGAACWRIDVGDRADVTFQLRDYFRRLDVHAEVRGPTQVELTTALDAVALGKLLSDWVRVVNVPARFVGRPTQPAPLAAKPVPRLGSLLVAKGFLTEARLELALNEARETGELLGLLLLRKRWIFEDELARTLSEQLLIPYVSVGRIGVNEAVARRVPHEVGERVAAIPVRVDGEAVQVAFADPTDPAAVDAISPYVDRISVAVAELTDIRLAWRSVGRVAAAGAR